MTNSQKILVKIMIYAIIPGVVLGAIGLLLLWLEKDSVASVFGVFAGVCGFTLVLTFFAFLVSLIVTSSKGN